LAASYRALLDYAGLGLKQTYLENSETEPAGLRPRLHSFVAGLDTYQLDASFDLFGGGGLVSTTKDLTTFYRALFAGRVVNKTGLEAMTSAVSGGGFGEIAYSLGLMPFFIGNNACYGHEGFASVVVGHCPAIDYTFVYAAGSDLIPDIGLTNQGIGYQVADLLGINVAPKPYAKDIELTRCPPELPSQNANLTCGMVRVKESRGEAGSNKIRFPFVIAQHPTKRPQIEPLLLLGGGPDDPLIPNLPNLLGDPDAAAALLDGQDLVAIEYRGVGASTPRLGCDTALTDDASVAQCIQKFTQLGVNLSRYNSVEIAADLEQLRRSLKVSRWNLLGFSYGTRIALTMLRERPSTIKSLSLDGAFPPEAPFANPNEFAQTVELALTNCQLNADCNGAFPQLKTRFIEAVNSFNITPIQINGRSISGDDVIQTLVPLQSSPEILAYLPAALDGLAKRNIELLSVFFGDTSIPVPTGKSFSTAMFFSVVCNEEVPFLDRTQLAALAEGAEPLRRGSAKNLLLNANVCNQWPSGRAAEQQNQAVPLTVPTIVFNGQFDLQTPPATGRALGNSSPLARGFEFPAVGHIALQQAPACALTILADFQRNQNAQAVDASCLYQLPAVRWKTKLDEGFFLLLGGS
jgi:pimeloyl-ACP methyl ester carboxylesterase